MIDFRSWLDKELQEMSKLGWGKFHDKEIQKALPSDTGHVPDPYMNWISDNITSPARKQQPTWDELQKEIEMRRSGQKPVPHSGASLPNQTSERKWFYAKVTKKGDSRFKFGAEIAASRGKSGNWDFMVLANPSDKGVIKADELKLGIIESLRNPKTNDKLFSLNPSLEDLEQQFNAMGGKNPEEQPEPEQTQPQSKKDKRLIPENLISNEQQNIDQRFGEIFQGQEQDHIMINALAGTGKTTMLKHLAWKYGKPGQKWLYIVFNTKNKVEASEEFPPFVQVRTSNGFLGEVLNMRENVTRIGQTDRMVKLAELQRGDQGGKLEKSRMVADSREFSGLMQKMGMPEKVDSYEYGKVGKTLNSLLKGIRFNFKEVVIKLVGLGKSFALDPRNPQGLEAGLANILESYDIDTSLTDIKERISKYSPSYRDTVVDYLEEALGYDFMQKDYKEEAKKSATWMLGQLMPNASTMSHQMGKRSHELSKFRDFDDDLWYTATHADQIQWPHFDFVLADEVQDFNECQKVMLNQLSKSGAKIVAVGDPHQCHPAGTMVEITGKGKKPIEEVVPGDEVVVYNTKKSYFPGITSQGRKVEEVAENDYSGEMIEIKAGNHSQKCTPNHRCLTRFNADNNKFCLYLMTKNNWARVGICKINYKESFGLSSRANQEGADQAWLLDVYDSERSARMAENVVSIKYQLPQLMFLNNGTNAHTQDFINEFYNQSENVFQVRKCLEDFGRIYEYPFWSKEQQIRHGKLKQNYIGSKKSFMTQACNLIEDVMSVRIYENDSRAGEWSPIKISKEKYQGKIYSLKVQPTEDGKRIYIANNIVTFNSIYRFRGADGQAFGNLANMLGDISQGQGETVYNLTQNFRSRPAILDFANEETHVSGLQSGRQWPDGNNGKVTNSEVKYNDVFDQLGQEVQENGKIPQVTAFIARTNEPLVKTALSFLAKKVPFIIVGKDIARDLIRHVRKISNIKGLRDDDVSASLSAELSGFLDDEKDHHGGKSTKKAYLQETEELTDALLASISAYEQDAGGRGTIGGFKGWISARLGGLEVEENEKDLRKYKQLMEQQNPIVLTTSHKSKGLEFSRVYILRYDQFPHPKAVQSGIEADLEQEENARYVALTRAQDELHILDLENQPGYKGNQGSGGEGFDEEPKKW